MKEDVLSFYWTRVLFLTPTLKGRNKRKANWAYYPQIATGKAENVYFTRLAGRYSPAEKMKMELGDFP
jgi:hypothetical protein